LKAVSFLILILTSSLGVLAQEIHNAEEAFRLSHETKKPVLLVFSGSDWCAPCILFDKKVLSQESFQTFAKNNLIVLKADFPQRKKIAEDVKKQNDALAEKYNPKGLFPHVMLILPGHSTPATLSYTNETPDEFISEINAHLANE
jgi:thiol-disulfide isomerase/thioredoxin